MTSNRETPDHIELAKIMHSLHDALLRVEGSQGNENLDFGKFIVELDQNPDFHHYPAYIIFKQANILLIGAQGAFLDSIFTEIGSNLDNITNLESSYIKLDLENPSENIKRNIAQRGILAIFLWRAALDGLYIPNTTGLSGIILKIVDSLNPPDSSL